MERASASVPSPPARTPSQASPAADSGAGHPVTVVVSRRPRPGLEAELEACLRGVMHVAAGFTGHLGAELFPPDPPTSSDCVLVFRFADATSLAAWERSPERKEWMLQAERLVEGTPAVHRLSGLEGWFSLPGRMLVAPRRWKMALVTGGVIFPLSLAITTLGAPLLGHLAVPLRPLATTAMLVPLMTWAVMPQVTRLLRRWLFG